MSFASSSNVIRFIPGGGCGASLKRIPRFFLNGNKGGFDRTGDCLLFNLFNPDFPDECGFPFTGAPNLA
jgi:hypothetical protein